MIVHYSPEKIEIKKSILDLLIKCQDKMQIVRCSVLDSIVVTGGAAVPGPGLGIWSIHDRSCNKIFLDIN